MEHLSHIFYVPHADDETLSMGAAIIECLRAGNEVYLALLTDGAADETLACLNGSFQCPWHGCFHNPEEERFRDIPMSPKAFSRARREEFLAAARVMGIPDEHISVYSFPDGRLTTNNVREIVHCYEEDKTLPFPKRHHTMTFKYDTHNDHISAGRALLELQNEGVIAESTWYIKRSMWHTLPPDSGIKTIKVISTMGQRILAEICKQVYMSYAPTEGKYAIGYHSVPRSVEGVFFDFSSKYHH